MRCILGLELLKSYWAQCPIARLIQTQARARIMTNKIIDEALMRTIAKELDKVMDDTGIEFSMDFWFLDHVDVSLDDVVDALVDADITSIEEAVEKMLN